MIEIKVDKDNKGTTIDIKLEGSNSELIKQLSYIFDDLLDKERDVFILALANCKMMTKA